MVSEAAAIKDELIHILEHSCCKFIRYPKGFEQNGGMTEGR